MSAQTVPGTNGSAKFKKAMKAIWSVSGAKFVAWFITTTVSTVALVLAILALQEQHPAEVLSQDQIQQLMELQRTNPTGTITAITPYQGHSVGKAVIKDVRDDPLLPDQIGNLGGSASNVPANGDLFVVVHSYGGRTSGLEDTPSLYFFTPVTPLFGTSVVNQRWLAPGVYFGGKVAPTTVTFYGVSLYFCDSPDSALIFAAIANPVKQNAGFLTMPYPSCKQLDSIFVRRGPAKT